MVSKPLRFLSFLSKRKYIEPAKSKLALPFTPSLPVLQALTRRLQYTLSSCGLSTDKRQLDDDRLFTGANQHTADNMASENPKRQPKVFTRKVTTSSVNNHSVASQPGALNVEEKLKEWENQIDIENLSSGHKIIHKAHMKAVKDGEDTYEDPVTGFQVFTILSHLKRGVCCGNACRHCPFKHINVQGRFRELKEFNTSYYA